MGTYLSLDESQGFLSYLASTLKHSELYSLFQPKRRAQKKSWLLTGKSGKKGRVVETTSASSRNCRNQYPHSKRKVPLECEDKLSEIEEKNNGSVENDYIDFEEKRYVIDPVNRHIAFEEKDSDERLVQYQCRGIDVKIYFLLSQALLQNNCKLTLIQCYQLFRSPNFLTGMAASARHRKTGWVDMRLDEPPKNAFKFKKPSDNELTGQWPVLTPAQQKGTLFSSCEGKKKKITVSVYKPNGIYKH